MNTEEKQDSAVINAGSDTGADADSSQTSTTPPPSPPKKQETLGQMLIRIFLTHEKERQPHWGVTVVGVLAICASFYFLSLLTNRYGDPSVYIICQASLIGDDEMVARILQESNRSKNLANARIGGLHALHWGVIGGSQRVLEILLAHDADINITEDHGITPLHIAAAEGYERLVQFLIDHHASINAQDENGSTPLDWAISRKKFDAAKVLRDNGGLEKVAPPPPPRLAPPQPKEKAPEEIT